MIVVVGAGGDRDTGKRPVMGAEAARRADLLIVTDDNPRSEDPAAIRAELLAGAPRRAGSASRAAVLEIGDRRAAIRAAVAAARTGRRGDHRRQGPRAGPGRRRRGAPVLRRAS